MIKITQLTDLTKIPDKEIIPYIRQLYERISAEYNDHRPNGIESIGAIFFITSRADLDKYSELGLSMPIDERRFEWIDDIEYGFVDACIVLDNDTAINLIGKRECFDDFMED